MIDENSVRQYDFVNDQLILKVKRSPLFVRGVMFTFSFLFFLMPVVGLLIGIALGTGLHIVYFISMFFFGLLGFYLLRVSLWNTFGKEMIQFHENRVEYVADYGWFKDGRKEKKIAQPLQFEMQPLGYEDDRKSALIIGDGDSRIFCATKMPNAELEGLIDQLKQRTIG